MAMIAACRETLLRLTFPSRETPGGVKEGNSGVDQGFGDVLSSDGPGNGLLCISKTVKLGITDKQIK